MTVNIYLLLISGLYLLFILMFYHLDRRHNRDIFSAVKLVAYFACIELFVLVWFAIDSNLIKELIFEIVAPAFRDMQLVYLAYFFSIIIYFSISVGVFLGSYGASRMPLLIDKLFLHSRAIGKKHTLSLGIFLYALGIILYLFFLKQIGGLISLWLQIGLRTTLTAGLGYIQVVYNFLIMMGLFLIYVVAARKRQWLLFTVFMIGAVFILASLGQRGPVATVIFIILLIHHYKVNNIRNILNFKMAVLVILMISFLFFFIQIRHGNLTINYEGIKYVSSENRFKVDVIKRLGIIERQIVVIGYFNEHDFWYGGLYESLLHAYKLRSSFPNKPPIDTGVYLNAIRQGFVIHPPMPTNSLEASSWPDGYLAGYMSFGFIGLILISVISGLVFGFFYKLVLLSNFAIGPIIFYGLLGFRGAKPLSPYGITQILIIFILFSIIGFFSSLSSVNKRSIQRNLNPTNG